MTRSLRISPDLALPLDFATEGVIVLGMRGSGKSNTEARFAEVEHDAGIPFVVVDPKGDWHGIRTSADGTKAGLPVPVFGGLHGDFPLEASLGKRIADLLVDENLSAVLDVSRMSKTIELPRFLADFFDQLMLRHQEEPHVRTVILEEAHRYIPQQVPTSMARVKEAAGAVLLEGRAWGLGCWACSQRPARINKDILEEVSTAILHRIGPTATNDKRTIAGWVKHYDLSDEIIRSITKLRDGEGWVLAPVSLGILQLVQMDRRRTFDSAATPKVGERRRRPSTMADIDAGAIKEALADTIEKAKADDPKELRRRIAALEKEQKQRPAEKVEVPVEVEVPLVTEEDIATLTALWERVGHEQAELEDLLGNYIGQVEAVQRDRQDVSRARPAGDRARAVADRQRPHRTPQRPGPPERREPRRATVQGAETGELPGGEAKVLTATAQHPAGVTREQLTVLTGYKRSTRDAYLQRLGTKGYVSIAGRTVRATDTGIEALGDDFEPLPTGDALREHWLATLPEGERAILAELADVWPDGLSREDLSETTGYKRSTRDAYIQRLRTRQLVIVDGGSVFASEVLFE